MALNVKELTDFILPLVQSGKEEEAKNLLAQAGKKQPATRTAGAKNSKGGLLDTVGSLLGTESSGGGLLSTVGSLLGGGSSAGGLLDSLGGLLGNSGGGALSGLLSILPALLKLVKPENMGVVSNYLTGIVDKEKRTATKKTAARSVVPKSAAGAKKTIAPKKPVGGAARKTAPAKQRPTVHRPAKP